MKDYSDIGLNDKFQAINGLSAREQPGMERTYFPAPSISNPPGVISGTAGTALVDGRGVVSTSNFQIYSDSGTPNFSFTSGTYANVTGASFSFTLKRSIKAFVFLSAVCVSSPTTSADASGRNYLRLNDNINGELIDLFYDSFLEFSSGIRENMINTTYNTSGAIDLSSGDHTVTLQARVVTNTNLTSNVQNFDVGLIILGI